MSQTSIQVTAASRLHFGLFSFGRCAPGQREFGGVGMMIDEPGLQLKIEPAGEFLASGPLADRVKKFALRWASVNGSDNVPGCHIHVTAVPPQHAGLGTGTQLGLSVAAGLNVYFGRPAATPLQLAEMTARGARSAIGVYGFVHGGLIVEDGKLPGEALSPLLNRSAVPDDWRVVLVRPQHAVGLSGKSERSAFRELPPVADSTSQSLRREVVAQMLPALADSDFARFSESVYQFGKAAGECFAAAQGGSYNGPVLAEIVRVARRLGVAGVGQSSWGPTIFCLLPDEKSAETFVKKLSNELGSTDIECRISRPCNHGANIK